MRVKVQRGITVNMGNYESARVDYAIEKDCAKNEQEDTKTELTNVIDSWIKKDVSELDRIRASKGE